MIVIKTIENKMKVNNIKTQQQQQKEGKTTMLYKKTKADKKVLHKREREKRITK